MDNEMLERMLNKLLLSNCGAQHSELILFSMRICAFCMIVLIVSMLIGLLHDVLGIVKCCTQAFLDGLAAVWRDVCVLLKTLYWLSFQASAVCVAATKEVWPHCTKDNVVMVSSIILLFNTFPGMVSSVERLLERLLTDTAPLPCATT